MRIAIAGGGIGGLAAALAAARAGHEVHVLERAPGFSEIGAGIQLAPNAFHALDLLGVGAEVRATAVRVTELSLRDGRSGHVLARLPLDAGFERRFGNPYAVVGRTDLHGALLDACQADRRIQLRPGAALTGYADRGPDVRCRLASGEQLTADGLVGADGIRSTVRRQLLGDGDPRVSGHTIYRSVVPMTAVPPALRTNSVTLWAGPRWHLVCYPISRGRTLNLAITRDDGARTAVSGLPVAAAAVAARFPELRAIPRAMLELGRDWRSWVLCDRDPDPRWAAGRVVLLGDAAHPMLQYAAQGAAAALEDAVVLGTLLGDRTATVAESFARFAAAREGRAARLQLAARWMGDELYHPSGLHAARRDAMLAGLTPAGLLDAVAWVHGARVGPPLRTG